MTIWERLGIAPTTDKKAIKKAYAARVKDCHQEDEPERWAQLHDAYKSALKLPRLAAGGNRKTMRLTGNREKIFFMKSRRKRSAIHYGSRRSSSRQGKSRNYRMMIPNGRRLLI